MATTIFFTRRLFSTKKDMMGFDRRPEEPSAMPMALDDEPCIAESPPTTLSVRFPSLGVLAVGMLNNQTARSC